MRSDGKSVSAAHVTAHCQSDPAAYANWHDRLRNGNPPAWLQKGEKSKKWSIEEEERTLEALSDLPPSLLVDAVHGIYRMDKSEIDETNPASGVRGEIVLYDQAFDSKQNLSRILAHEFSHEEFRQMPDDEKFQYLKAADWLAVRNPRTEEFQLIPNRDGFVEEDGKENPGEDFSNNVEYFLFNPNALREKTPKAYDWIKRKFGDNFRLRKGS